MNKKTIRIFLIAIRIGLGSLFIYGGVQKFIPKPPRPTTEVSQQVPDHVLKIRSHIGGLKQTGYFWEMLGIMELICGILLVTQYLALLGAIMLVPITLNIFLFHVYLEPHDIKELIMTLLYLVGNIMIIRYHYPQLKPIFLNFKSIP